MTPAAPDFTVTLALDRYEAPAGGGTAVAVANVARLNGYAGPVELSIVGDAASERHATGSGGADAGVRAAAGEGRHQAGAHTRSG